MLPTKPAPPIDAVYGWNWPRPTNCRAEFVTKPVFKAASAETARRLTAAGRQRLGRTTSVVPSWKLDASARAFGPRVHTTAGLPEAQPGAKWAGGQAARKILPRGEVHAHAPDEEPPLDAIDDELAEADPLVASQARYEIVRVAPYDESPSSRPRSV